MVTLSYTEVDNFIESLDLPEIANGLLRTSNDCEEFYIGFYGTNRYVMDDLLDFKEFVVEKRKISVDEFVEMCYTSSMKDVFESVFLQEFTLVDIILVNEAIADGRTTLEDLYNGFLKKPTKKIMINVL
jgi:hypothetical protein